MRDPETGMFWLLMGVLVLAVIVVAILAVSAVFVVSRSLIA